MKKLLTALALVATGLMAGCEDLSTTVSIGVIEGWEYAGDCQTTVTTKEYKFEVDGMHGFKPGSNAEVITYKMNNSPDVLILFLPDTHQRALISCTPEEFWPEGE